MNNEEYSKIDFKYNRNQQKILWNAAVGLQAVDSLEPSEYLKELAEQNIEGVLSTEKIEELLYSHYEEVTPEENVLRVKECDIVSNRIVELLQMKGTGISLTPVSLKSIHRYLFHDIYENAGEFRDFNISKKEAILNNRSVKYANFFMIEDTLKYDMEEERNKAYKPEEKESVIRRISRFTSSIWQVHPFAEGNTRTTAVFMEKYLNGLGFEVDNKMFEKNSKYFRNSLVRSNYTDFSQEITANHSFLENFYKNLLYGEQNILQSRQLIVQKLFADQERETL